MPSQLGVGLRRADLEGPGLGGSLSLEARDSAAPTLPSSLSLWSLDQPPRLSLVFGPLHGLICMSTNWSLRVSFHPNAALGERAVGSAAPSRASCLARPLSFGSHPLPSPLGEFAYLAHAFVSAWVDSHAPPLANDDAHRTDCGCCHVRGRLARLCAELHGPGTQPSFAPEQCCSVYQHEDRPSSSAIFLHCSRAENQPENPRSKRVFACVCAEASSVCGHSACVGSLALADTTCAFVSRVLGMNMHSRALPSYMCKVHHDKHHAKYVNVANQMIEV